MATQPASIVSSTAVPEVVAVISDFTSMTCSFETTFNGDTYHTISVMDGYGQLSYGVVYQQHCADTSGIVPPPPPANAEPPFPPVWPYPLQNIYQREFWSMDVHMIRADTKIWDLFVFQDEDRLDLTGMIMRFTAKWSYFDDDAAAVIKLDNSTLTGIVVTDASQGEATLTIPKTATDIPAIPYHRTILFYDIKIQVISTGAEHTIARGRLIINPNATTAI